MWNAECESNPKSETRNPKQVRIPKLEMSSSGSSFFMVRICSFRIYFEVRISDLPSHIFEKFQDDLVGRLAFGVRLEGANQAVTQHEWRECGNVFASSVEAALASG